MDGGGRSHYGGGGRHYNRGGRHRHGGRGRGYRHQPYRQRGGRGGGRGNRFGAGQNRQDPETLLLRQIASFVSRAGELHNLRESENADLRNVEYTTASNINDLVPILCAPDKLDLLFRFSAEASKPEEKVGKLVDMLVSCATALPLQTPCYAALTLSLDAQVKGTPHDGFATRCLQHTMLQVARDLDTSLLIPNQCLSQSTCRLKLLLRYLAILGNMGMVKAFDGEGTVDPNRMTVLGLLSVLVDAAVAAAEQFNNPKAAHWLALLVLSTLPYLTDSLPSELVEEKLFKPIERVLGGYRSTFTPGTGISSVLLRDAQVEEEEEDDEAEDEDDDEDLEAAGQVCDSLQDLLRATKQWKAEGRASRFALPLDSPWKGLLRTSTPNPESGETESTPVSFAEEPLFLAFPQECQLLNLLLGGIGTDSPLKLHCSDLEGAVFGRLPIFGSPSDPDDAEDEDDDEEGMEETKPKSEQLQAFENYSLLDRYFVAESLRDCLLSHEGYVNPTGVQHGGPKNAAEELLRVCHVFSGETTSNGMEYAILETMFALLAQANEFSGVRHAFLSRVLLELTRIEPSRFSQALAVAMTNLFEDYLPALVPVARDNFSRWFAFHLTNTDYQWPSAFWQLWEPYALSEKPSSRGFFVRRALNVMAENISDPSPIQNQSITTSCALQKEFLGRSIVTLSENAELALESEIRRRIWDNSEDPSLLLEYMMGEDVKSAVGSLGGWARSDLLIRAVLHPAREWQESLRTMLDNPTGGEDDMADDSAFSKDVYGSITECVGRYKETILGLLSSDSESTGTGEDTSMATVKGAAFLLRTVESMSSFNANLLQGIVCHLVSSRIVTCQAVLRWVLRDVGDSVLAPVDTRWAVYASNAIREQLLLISSDVTAGGTMVVDGSSSDGGSQFASRVGMEVGQVLHYSVQRVCSLLVTAQSDDKRLRPLHVDLVEGAKTLVFSTRKQAELMLSHPHAVPTPIRCSVDELQAKAEFSGSALAAKCTGEESSPGVKLLKKCLEAM